MNRHTAVGNATDSTNSSAEVSGLRLELEALQQRLAALEEGGPISALAQPRAHGMNARTIRNMVALVMVIAVLAVLANAPLVHGQSVVALFVDENGNVGIGTKNPNATLDVAGNAIVTGTIVAGKIGIGTANRRNWMLTVLSRDVHHRAYYQRQRH